MPRGSAASCAWPGARWAAPAAGLLLVAAGLAWRGARPGPAAGGARPRSLQAATYSKQHVERCREPRGTVQSYDVVSSLPPVTMENCGSAAAADFLPTNDDVTHISHRCLSRMCGQSASGSPSAEVVLVVRRRGPIYQLDVETDGDYRHWTLNLPPTRVIRAHSCLDDQLFCDAVSVTPLESGFIVMDRHRVSEFRFTWQPEATESVAWRLGQMNALPSSPSASSLRFPSAAAVYRPLNSTHIDEASEVSAFFPHAGSRLVLVSDAGNHRVLVLNATAPGQFDYAGQFGVTGEARHNGTGLDTPWGLAVYAPGWDSLYRPVFANVFVADRRNNRLVKLDLGYEGAGYPRAGELPGLMYGGAYEGLGEPVGVAVYRHYVLVAEARGNAIAVLVVDHARTSRLRLVTRLRPAAGVQLTGSLAVSPLGYVWFAYLGLPNAQGVGNIFLPEALRWSARPTRLRDLVRACVNESWYHDVVRFDLALYASHVGGALSSVGINWIDASRPGYLDAGVFNRSDSFDLAAFNRTVFGGQMVLCGPPPPPVPPPMLSGNEQGWNMANRRPTAMARAAPRRTTALWLVGAWWACCGGAPRGPRAAR